MILALDLGSTITGWAVGHGMTIVGHGAWYLKPSRFDDYGMRAVRMQNELKNVAKRYFIREVVFERIDFRGAKSSVNEAQLYGLIYGTMALWCKNSLLPFYGVPPNIWKKQVIGKGNASKAEVKTTVERIIHATVDEQDEADAIAILLWRLYNPTTY